MAHQDQFLIHRLTVLRYRQALGVAFRPLAEIFVFLFTTTEEEDAGLGVFLEQLLDDLFHQPWRIDLSLVGRKGSNADPLLEVLLRTYFLGQHIQVATLCWEDAMKLFDVDRIAQACKDF